MNPARSAPNTSVTAGVELDDTTPAACWRSLDISTSMLPFFSPKYTIGCVGDAADPVPLPQFLNTQRWINVPVPCVDLNICVASS